MIPPVIAITMGDPAGIGAEITLKAMRDYVRRTRCLPLLVGDPAVFRRAARLVDGALPVRSIHSLEDAEYGDALDCLVTPIPAPTNAPWGAIDVISASAMLAPLDIACDLALTGRIRGFVSAPLNKEAFALLDQSYGDELEYLAERTHSMNAFTVGIMNGVWVASVAEHVRFRAIADMIIHANVLRYIRGLSDSMQRAGQERPRIAVAALNVHGGEGGALGTEEITDIGPAVQEARAEGIDAIGPIPADTVFARALAGEFAGVVSMYHDQANIARKLQPMAKRVTQFEGLPVPCTTTAHGVAYDIAGKGVADPSGMQAAIDHLIWLTGRRR